MVSTNVMQHQKHFTHSNFVHFFSSIQWTFYFLKYIMDKLVQNNGYQWTMIIIHVMVMKLMWNGCKIIVELVLYGLDYYGSRCDGHVKYPLLFYKKLWCKRSKSYWLWICGYGSKISSWYKAKLR